MKSLSKYLTESSSLFDDIGGWNCPTSYIAYNSGDKTFGSLTENDIIYYWDEVYTDGKVIEVKINKAGVLRDNNYNYCLSIEPITYGKRKIKLLVIGPSNASTNFDNDDNGLKEYDPAKVAESSICVSVKAKQGFIFGTNKDTVVKSVKMDINSKIEKIHKEIEVLQNSIVKLNNNLNSLIK